MKVRFFYLLLLFFTTQVLSCCAFVSSALSAASGPAPSIGEQEFAKLTGGGQQQETALQVAEKFITHSGIRQEAISYIGSLIPDYNAWEQANKEKAEGKKRSIFARNPMKKVFDFTHVNHDDGSWGLMVSGVAALNFCATMGAAHASERKVKYMAPTSSVFKRGFQAGINKLTNKKQMFTLPPLTKETSTCQRLRKDFCENVCTKNLCGADALYGAVCVKTCWNQMATNSKLKHCQDDFRARFMLHANNTVVDHSLTHCAVKHTQLERKRGLRKGIAVMTGKAENLALAKECAKLMTIPELQSSPITMPCVQLMQTCKLPKDASKQLRLSINAIKMRMNLQRMQTGALDLSQINFSDPSLRAGQGSLMGRNGRRPNFRRMRNMQTMQQQRMIHQQMILAAQQQKLMQQRMMMQQGGMGNQAMNNTGMFNPNVNLDDSDTWQ